MISASDRQYVISLIDDAVANGAGLVRACTELGITDRTYYRWKGKLKRTGNIADLRPIIERPTPANKLSVDEEKHVLAVLNSPEFADSSPRQVVPNLADRGQYLASESTMYRLPHKNNMCHHRRRGKVHVHRDIPSLSANAPNQIWMWDITYMPGPIKGSFFYLYCISDLFSRYTTGWEVWEEQQRRRVRHENVQRNAQLSDKKRPLQH